LEIASNLDTDELITSASSNPTVKQILKDGAVATHQDDETEADFNERYKENTKMMLNWLEVY